MRASSILAGRILCTRVCLVLLDACAAVIVARPRIAPERGGTRMSARVESELLLVGSLPAASTEEALREGAEFFGDLVFALPDGETGPRAAWVGLRAGAADEAEPRLRARCRDGVAVRAATPRVRDADLQGARRRRRAVGRMAAHRRCDRVIPELSAGCGSDGVIPGAGALPDRVAVPLQRAERVQGRVRGGLCGGRASVRRPRSP